MGSSWLRFQFLLRMCMRLNDLRQIHSTGSGRPHGEVTCMRVTSIVEPGKITADMHISGQFVRVILSHLFPRLMARSCQSTEDK